jgi:hypothetical protein
MTLNAPERRTLAQRARAHGGGEAAQPALRNRIVLNQP